jgi:hypothetical protein
MQQVDLLIVHNVRKLYPHVMFFLKPMVAFNLGTCGPTVLCGIILYLQLLVLDMFHPYVFGLKVFNRQKHLVNIALIKSVKLLYCFVVRMYFIPGMLLPCLVGVIKYYVGGEYYNKVTV